MSSIHVKEDFSTQGTTGVTPVAHSFLTDVKNKLKTANADRGRYTAYDNLIHNMKDNKNYTADEQEILLEHYRPRVLIPKTSKDIPIDPQSKTYFRSSSIGGNSNAVVDEEQDKKKAVIKKYQNDYPNWNKYNKDATEGGRLRNSKVKDINLATNIVGSVLGYMNDPLVLGTTIATSGLSLPADIAGIGTNMAYAAGREALVGSVIEAANQESGTYDYNVAKYGRSKANEMFVKDIATTSLLAGGLGAVGSVAKDINTMKTIKNSTFSNAEALNKNIDEALLKPNLSENMKNALNDTRTAAVREYNIPPDMTKHQRLKLFNKASRMSDANADKFLKTHGIGKPDVVDLFGRPTRVPDIIASLRDKHGLTEFDDIIGELTPTDEGYLLDRIFADSKRNLKRTSKPVVPVEEFVKRSREDEDVYTGKKPKTRDVKDTHVLNKPGEVKPGRFTAEDFHYTLTNRLAHSGIGDFISSTTGYELNPKTLISFSEILNESGIHGNYASILKGKILSTPELTKNQLLDIVSKYSSLPREKLSEFFHVDKLDGDGLTKLFDNAKLSAEDTAKIYSELPGHYKVREALEYFKEDAVAQQSLLNATGFTTATDYVEAANKLRVPQDKINQVRKAIEFFRGDDIVPWNAKSTFGKIASIAKKGVVTLYGAGWFITVPLGDFAHMIAHRGLWYSVSTLAERLKLMVSEESRVLYSKELGIDLNMEGKQVRQSANQHETIEGHTTLDRIAKAVGVAEDLAVKIGRAEPNTEASILMAVKEIQLNITEANKYLGEEFVSSLPRTEKGLIDKAKLTAEQASKWNAYEHQMSLRLMPQMSKYIKYLTVGKVDGQEARELASVAMFFKSFPLTAIHIAYNTFKDTLVNKAGLIINHTVAGTLTGFISDLVYNKSRGKDFDYDFTPTNLTKWLMRGDPSLFLSQVNALLSNNPYDKTMFSSIFVGNVYKSIVDRAVEGKLRLEDIPVIGKHPAFLTLMSVLMSEPTANKK